MKVLVTGATGSIGNYVVNRLLKENCILIATSLIPLDKAKTFNWFSKVEYIQCDLNERQRNFFKFFKQPDMMIHLAWEGLPNYSDLFHIEKNIFSNYYFIKNMIENGLNNFSVIGTCLEYGMQEGCLEEDMVTNPVNPYALAKDTLRKFIVELNKKYAFNYKWIRLFYIYGKGLSPNSILSQLNRALENNENSFNMSGGEQLRDYLPVEKAVEYIVKLSLQNQTNGIFNCCSGKPISIRKLVEDYLEQHNKTIKLNLGYYPYPDYEPMVFWGDNTKLKKVLGL